MDSFHPDDQIVCLSTAPNPAQAHIWANALSEKGIQCHVVGDYLDAGIGDISGLRAELWVRRQDVAQAQPILDRRAASEVEVVAEKTSRAETQSC